MAKVLLVEDDNNLREIYEARLSAETYDIITAQNGEEALVVAKKEHPDLIISDVMMPRISGFEMLDILRNTDELRDTKVIMLTALGQAEDQTRAGKLGADKYLVKSQVTLEDIVNTANELLGITPAIMPQTTSATEIDTAPAATVPAAAVPTQAAAPSPAPAAAEPTAQPQPQMPPVATPQPAVTPPAAPPVEPTIPTEPSPPVAAPSPQTTATSVPTPTTAVPTPVASTPIVTVTDPDPIAVTPQSATPVATPEPIVPEPAIGSAPLEQSIAPPPAPAPAPAPEPAPTDTLANIQTTASEEAAVENQIEDFADAPPQPTMPASVAPAEPVAPAQLTASDIAPQEEQQTQAADANEQTLTEAVEDLTEAAGAGPEPVLPPSQKQLPGEETSPATEPDTSAPAVFVAPPIEPVVEPAPAEPGTTSAASPETQAVAGHKIIQPLNTTAGPSLDELLAREASKEQAGGAPPDTPIVSSGTPAATPPAAPGFDPNSIAL